MFSYVGKSGAVVEKRSIDQLTYPVSQYPMKLASSLSSGLLTCPLSQYPVDQYPVH